MLRPDFDTLVKWGIGTLLYFGWFAGVMGLRSEHVVLYVLITVMAWAHPSTRRLVWALSGWVIYWMVYDSLRIVPNYVVNPPVHIRDLYDLEKSFFGVEISQTRLTLNEWCAQHTQKWLDLLAGVLYLGWVPFPFVLGVWLHFRRPHIYLRFVYCFLLANLFGFAIYYLYPAAPPWYVADFGFDFNPNVPRSPAGLARFDELTGTQIFHNLYTRNSNVFAAMPSLHSAYPLVAWLYAARSGVVALRWVFGILTVGIWCTAVYSGHHYVLDVLAGISVALGAYFVFERVILRSRAGVWFEQMERRMMGKDRA
jgi:inositol phosphorylceramide synthase catalytic subunit